jgi:hypothetical protein
VPTLPQKARRRSEGCTEIVKRAREDSGLDKGREDDRWDGPSQRSIARVARPVHKEQGTMHDGTVGTVPSGEEMEDDGLSEFFSA